MELKSSTMAWITEALMVVAIALLVIYVSRMLFKQRKLNLPPGPTPLPIIGSFHLLDGKHPLESLLDLAQKYGPVMSVQLGQKFCVVATSPEAAKEFLKVQDANFNSRPPLRSAAIILRKGIVLQSITPVLLHLKKILVSELTSAKRLEGSKYLRAEEVAYMLRAISKETGPIRLKTYLFIVSANILSRMITSKGFLGAAGDQNVSEIHEYTEIVDETNFYLAANHLQDFFDCIPEWFDPQGLDARFHKLKARRDLFATNMINQHIEDRRKNPVSEGEKTLLDVLLDQLDNPEHKVTKENIRGVIMDALVAGTATTTLTSEWAMAEVLRNPTVLKEARSELDRVVGLNRTVQESDIPELKYIQAIVKEALRLHAIVINLQNEKATKVFGYDIPANTRVFVNIWGIGRDPTVWEKPLEFMPERFLAGAPHARTEFQGQHFEFIPFGAGRRLCPGIRFGSISAHLKVASLLHAFDWSFPDGMAPEKLDMTKGQGLLRPKRDALVVVAKPRLPSHLY